MSDEPTRAMVRELGRSAQALHTVAYYSPEIHRFDENGFRGWWHAYFAYRSAPMGPVPASVVTACFYNFAPRMVERAVPSCWDLLSPEAVRDRQLELVGEAFDRSLKTYDSPDDLRFCADVVAEATANLPVGARPLSAAWAAEPYPDDDALALWHACTVAREFRFDGHNLALVAAGVDAIECHVLMVSGGRGNGATIQKIRGWTADEWNGAVDRLVERGWVTEDLTQTDLGTAQRKAIERHTDDLSIALAEGLVGARADDCLQRLRRLVAHLTNSGEVSGVWPPPNVVVDRLHDEKNPVGDSTGHRSD